MGRELKPRETFQVGDRVTWTSGTRKALTKVGTVVQVVPGGSLPSRTHTEIYRDRDFPVPRDDESYVVWVEGVKTYWPKANWLRKYEEAA